MNNANFEKKYNIDFTKNIVNPDEINMFETLINIKFGNQLKEYILKYGYIGYLSVEFYGINSVQKQESDLITKTIYLHSYYKKTIGYIAFDNPNEGTYVLLDESDNVYSYDTELDALNNLNIKLFEYIEQKISKAI